MDTDEAPPQTWPAAWEWISSALVLIGAGIYTNSLWQGRWFHHDIWRFFSRDWSFTGLFSGHAGHPAIINVTLTKAIVALFGYDPKVFIVVRTVGWSLVVLSLWLVLRIRGAKPIPALMALSIFALWSLSSWHEGWYAANFVAITCGLFGSIATSEGSSPSIRKRLVTIVLLLVATFATSLGVIFTIAVNLSVLLRRRHRDWWGVSIPLGLFLLWSIALPADLQSNGSLASALDDPVGATIGTLSLALNALGSAFQNTLFFPASLAPWVALALVGAAAFAWSHRTLDTFDGILLLVMTGYAASVWLFRVSLGLGQETATRYQYTLGFLALLIIIPRIRLVRSVEALAAIALVLYVLPTNASLLERRSDFWINLSTRELTSIAIQDELLMEGEGVLDNPSTGVAVLTFPLFRELAADGLLESVTIEPTTQEESRARGFLVMKEIPTNSTSTQCEVFNVPTIVELNSDTRVFVSGDVLNIEMLSADGPAHAILTNPENRELLVHRDEVREVLRLSSDTLFTVCTGPI